MFQLKFIQFYKKEKLQKIIKLNMFQIQLLHRNQSGQLIQKSKKFIKI